MKLSKMFLTKKISTLVLLLFISIAAFSQSATVNLTEHAPIAATPSGSEFQWHSTATPSSADLLTGTAITAATTNPYYGVYYDSTSDCYSPAAKVDVKISDCGAATENLTTYQTDFTATVFEWYTESAGINKVGTPSAVTGGTYFLFDNNLGVLTRLNQVVIVSIIPVPSALTASATLQPTCSVATGTITVTAPKEAGMFYSIDGSTYTNTDGIFTTIVSGTYSVTAKNAVGCVSSISYVTINAQPATPSAPTASVTAQPTCSTATGTITVTVPSTGTGVTYTVTGTSPVVAAVTNATGIFSGLATGVYDVTTSLTTGSNTCTSPAVSKTIDAQPATPLAPTASLTQPTCSTATGTITLTLPAIGTGVTYTVTGTSPVVAAVTNATGIFSGLATGIYDVTTSLLTDPNNCTSSAVSLTINAQPETPAQPTLGNLTQATCIDFAQGSFQITNYNSTYNYTVSPSGNSSISGTGLVKVNPGNTYTVIAKLGTCSSIASSSVTLIPGKPANLPSVSFLTGPTCYYGTGTFKINYYDTAVYNYRIISSPIGGAATIDATGIVTVENGFDYFVQHQFVGGTSTCWSDNSQGITYPKMYMTAPALSATSATNTCPSLTVNLSALFTGTVPPGNTLVWYDNDTVPPTGSAVTNPAAATTGPTYYAFYKDDTNSCFASAPSAGVATTPSPACCPAGYVAPILH
jgi:hypothetical protein